MKGLGFVGAEVDDVADLGVEEALGALDDGVFEGLGLGGARAGGRESSWWAAGLSPIGRRLSFRVPWPDWMRAARRIFSASGLMTTRSMVLESSVWMLRVSPAISQEASARASAAEVWLLAAMRASMAADWRRAAGESSAAAGFCAEELSAGNSGDSVAGGSVAAGGAGGAGGVVERVRRSG